MSKNSKGAKVYSEGCAFICPNATGLPGCSAIKRK